MAPHRHSPLHWPRRFLDWLCDGRADYREFQERKATRAYKANQSTCLIIWLVAAGLLLICGATGCLVAFGLVATLLCFTVLDPE